MIAFLAALPSLLQIMIQLMGLVVKIVSLAEKNEFRKWMENLEQQIDLLEKAKSSDEKLQAARKLADIFKSLG